MTGISRGLIRACLEGLDCIVVGMVVDDGNDLPTAPLEGVVRLFDAVAIGCVRLVSVVNEFDGLLVKFGDGRNGEDSKNNGTGMTTGAVFAFGAGC